MPSTGVHPSFTREERRLRIALVAFAVLSVAFIVGYLLQGIVDHSDYPYVVNSVAKDGVFTFLCAARGRRRAPILIRGAAAHRRARVPRPGLLRARASPETTAPSSHTLGSNLPFGISATTLSYLWTAAAASSRRSSRGCT